MYSPMPDQREQIVRYYGFIVTLPEGFVKKKMKTPSLPLFSPYRLLSVKYNPAKLLFLQKTLCLLTFGPLFSLILFFCCFILSL